MQVSRGDNSNAIVPSVDGVATAPNSEPKEQHTENDSFSDLRLAPHDALHRAVRMKCTGTCGKQRRYFCSECVIPLVDPPRAVPKVQLPVHVHIVQSGAEAPQQSTAQHVALLERRVMQLSGDHFQNAQMPFMRRLYSTLISGLLQFYMAYTFERQNLKRYPSQGALLPSEAAAQLQQLRHLIVIDATWTKSAVMMQTPWLNKLPKVTLPPGIRSRFWRYAPKRGEHSEHFSPEKVVSLVSTVEAVHRFCDALGTAQGLEESFCDNLLWLFAFVHSRVRSVYQNTPDLFIAGLLSSYMLVHIDNTSSVFRLNLLGHRQQLESSPVPPYSISITAYHMSKYPKKVNMYTFVSAPASSLRIRRQSPLQALSRHSSRNSLGTQMSAASDEKPTSISRRALISSAAACAVVPFLPFSMPRAANAKVDIDIERFGDKELKVSTINKVKQNTRNVLAQRPELLPYFFSMTVHDALTFNPETLEGGPNGSLRFELERDVNSELRDAHEAIMGIQALQRQDMSYADTCAFAGAVAVEVTGGPRIIVQLGREDAKQADPVNRMDLYKTGASAEDLRTAFESAGLDGVRDVVLVHGAIGSLNDVGQIRAAKLQEQSIDRDGDDSDDEDSVGDFDDVTYGRVQRKKRGAVLVDSNVSLLTIGGQKFGNGYLKAVLKVKDPSALSQRDRTILDNAQMRAMVQQYADNNSKFLTDIADLFQKLSLLGSEFESMKLEA